MKRKKLIQLQMLGVLLYIGMAMLLYAHGFLNIVSSIIIYFLLAVCNVINAENHLIKPIEELSIYDKLTGCYNRTKLSYKTKEYENLRSYAVIFFDVNNMKKMNDIHGHEHGDKLIIKAANQLKYWRKYGDLYRIGGDEFLVVIPNSKLERVESELASWYIDLDDLNNGFQDGFVCKFSYGVCKKEPDEKISFEDVMNKADENMYTMKKVIKYQEKVLDLGEEKEDKII